MWWSFLWCVVVVVFNFLFRSLSYASAFAQTRRKEWILSIYSVYVAIVGMRDYDFTCKHYTLRGNGRENTKSEREREKIIKSVADDGCWSLSVVYWKKILMFFWFYFRALLYVCFYTFGKHTIKIHFYCVDLSLLYV